MKGGITEALLFQYVPNFVVRGGFNPCATLALRREAVSMISNIELSNHASARMQQRGVNHRALGFVLDNADKSEFVGSGCREQWISRRHLSRLRRRGADGHLIERAAGVSIVVSNDDMIVTVFHKTERTRHKKNKQHNFRTDPGTPTDARAMTIKYLLHVEAPPYL